MKQPLPYRQLFIRDRSARDLVRVLRNEDNVNQVKLVDLDGTLHKGLYEERLRGFTSADVALDLLMRGEVSFPFLRDNLRIFLRESGSLYADVQGEDRRKVTKELVQMFGKVLSRVDHERLEEVMEALPERAYPGAKSVLNMVGGETVIISCAMQSAVNAYGRFLGRSRLIGNPMFHSNESVSLGGNGIYGRVDKEVVADNVCKRKDRAVVFGDTVEDIGLAYAARRVSQESVVVALHGRSEDLEDKADIVTASWEDLGMLMYCFRDDRVTPKVVPYANGQEVPYLMKGAGIGIGQNEE